MFKVVLEKSRKFRSDVVNKFEFEIINKNIHRFALTLKDFLIPNRLKKLDPFKLGNLDILTLNQLYYKGFEDSTDFYRSLDELFNRDLDQLFDRDLNELYYRGWGDL